MGTLDPRERMPRSVLGGSTGDMGVTGIVWTTAAGPRAAFREQDLPSLQTNSAEIKADTGQR